jgi:hypothetical protein
MNSRHRRTLRAIFAKPTQAGIRWSEIEALFRALGANVREGEGPRVRVTLGEQRAVFHRPHPEPTTGRLTVRDVRDFLASAGFRPEGE